MDNTTYTKAIALLKRVSTPHGFLAAANDMANYKRVWARDGVICGLAALASGDSELIATFKNTLGTLAANQHANGTIPSNVKISGSENEISYGGLAGRVDAVTWFIIGVCQYTHHTNETEIIEKYKKNIEACLQLLEAWEFNNKHLLYVPLSGNWADEYITEGYVLYDQLLRILALKNYNHFAREPAITEKIRAITRQVEINFTPDGDGEKYHQKAFNEAKIQHFMPCSFSPAGYKSTFDAFGNALALILNIGTTHFQDRMVKHFTTITNLMPLQMIPAFWPPIEEKDLDWHLLRNNCKYEFRNYPNEFHNGGTWPMVNGFYGLALISKNRKNDAIQLLEAINKANEKEDYLFYENFNSKTTAPNGVPFCAWSAAATIMLHQALHHNFKILV